MDSKQKEYSWLLVVAIFYILTAFVGVYNLDMMLLWPFFAMPMSLFLIKTGQKEITLLAGIILSGIISLITTSGFNPIVIATFLLFVVAPGFVFGILYHQKVMIPKIIMMTTIVYFTSVIVLIAVGKLMGIDYLEAYFSMLDTVQDGWTQYVADLTSQQGFPEGEEVIELYTGVMVETIRMAKRTYPATLFTVGLMTSTLHLLLIQLIARIRAWNRPKMKDILNVALTPAAVWVLIILWIITAQMGSTDTIWTFATESMLRVLFGLFQIVGVITVIVMIRKIAPTKMMRVILWIFGLVWLIFNPILLVIIGCMDSIFNFRKAKLFI